YVLTSNGYTLYDTLDIVVHDPIGSPGLIIHHVVLPSSYSIRGSLFPSRQASVSSNLTACSCTFVD
ncbi:hypothetical protein P5673_008901, partial [Acropora cervicornis]